MVNSTVWRGSRHNLSQVSRLVKVPRPTRRACITIGPILCVEWSLVGSVCRGGGLPRLTHSLQSVASVRRQRPTPVQNSTHRHGDSTVFAAIIQDP